MLQIIRIWLKRIPCVTHSMKNSMYVYTLCVTLQFQTSVGLLYTYLAEWSGNTTGKGALAH